jgi:hypothetical protein
VAVLGALAGCHRQPAVVDSGAVDAGRVHLVEREPIVRADQAMGVTSSQVVVG